MTADLGTSSRSATSVVPGSPLGEFVIEGTLRRTAVGEAFRASHPQIGALTLHVIAPELARQPAVRDAIAQAAREAAALPEHKHLVRTFGAGVTDGVLWVATEELDGSTLRELLARKREAGAGGFGARGAGNLVLGVASALSAAGFAHGALSTESVVVNRAGRVRLADLALGPGVAAAIAAGQAAAGSHVAPEVAQGAAPSGSADVYGLGALLYEALLGRPLERGGPRPSEAVAGLTTQVDELIARACHRDPDRRFGSAEVFKELVADALGRGGAVEEESSGAVSASQSAAHAVSQSGAYSRPSLAQAIAQPGAPVAAVDPALQAALADTTEKWLIAKGRLDYGPFSLAEVLDQIRGHQIVAGNVIVDKDTGARVDVAEHPLLGPLVDRARQDHDMKRRAEAEVAHESTEKKRHLMLYAFIGAGVLAAGLAVYFIVQSARADETKSVSGVSKLAEGSLEVKMSEPKAPPRRAAGGGGGGGGGRRSGGGGGGSETLSLDMSGDEDDAGGSPLPMGTVFQVYSKYGGQLGGCLASTGARSAAIAIIIDGPSGRVNWVRVNGEASGSLHGCMSRVLKSMKFPSTDGPRTRAEFDIGL
jgi:serine/threonine protein kinase